LYGNLIRFAHENFYYLYLAYGKSDITKLVRHVLHSIAAANGTNGDVCVDEFTRAGLINSLDRSTKIFITDEADISFADTGLFNCYAKPSAESNCRCMFHFVTVRNSLIIHVVIV